MGRISGKWSTAEKAKRHIFLCLFNKLLIMAGASGLREGVCFLPVVVDVIECSCRAFLHGVLCLGKVQCWRMFCQDMLTQGKREGTEGICVS